MKIKVRFFASQHEATGQRDYELELPQQASAQQAFERLCTVFPTLRGAARSVAFAVNQVQADGSVALHEGDELALLPPMAGG